jgi:hypothetical protein
MQKAPRWRTTRGFHQKLSNNGLKDSPSCLADCFSWPQVALTHHVFIVIQALRAGGVKRLRQVTLDCSTGFRRVASA